MIPGVFGVEINYVQERTQSLELVWWMSPRVVVKGEGKRVLLSNGM
jgi:hypothetical protein